MLVMILEQARLDCKFPQKASFLKTLHTVSWRGLIFFNCPFDI